MLVCLSILDFSLVLSRIVCLPTELKCHFMTANLNGRQFRLHPATYARANIRSSKMSPDSIANTVGHSISLCVAGLTDFSHHAMLYCCCLVIGSCSNEHRPTACVQFSALHSNYAKASRKDEFLTFK